MQNQRTKNAVGSLVSFFESNKSRSSFKTVRNIDCGMIVTRSKALITAQSVIKSMLERENPLQMCTLCHWGGLKNIVKIQQWTRKQLKLVKTRKALQKRSVLALQSLARGKVAREQLLRQKAEKVVVESVKTAPKTKRTKKVKKTRKSTMKRTHRCSNPNCWKNHTTNFTATLFNGEYLWEDKKSVIKIKPSTKKLTVAKAPKFYTSRRGRRTSK